ncbi:MAG TPA: hypothetical protein PLV68_01655 [Ilumatobacteraceae bacterium]|nr:hypothetical protein [Ilumatobacteraceae bacterium]
MRVRELIDFLREQSPDAEVEMAIVAPVSDDSDEITVDRFSIDVMVPEDRVRTLVDDDSGDEALIWLVGGEEDDIDWFLEAADELDHDHDDDDHDHPHH